ncbi:MAG: GH3 auxin-responsive promoter family protein [Gemmataceae bacterium]
MPGLSERAANVLREFFFQGIVSPILSLSIKRKIRQFEQATKNPQDSQQKLLMAILRRHQNTSFAKDHHFSSIQSIDEFRNNIGVAGYETIEPYMNRVLKGENSALLADRRIHMFALTSGTTNTRKYIPVTDSYLENYRRGWNIWGLNAFLKHEKAKFQPILQMSGDWDEYRSDSGVPCGSVTGLTARMQRKVIRWLYCVPPEVSRIKDSASKYYTVMRLSIDRPVGLILAANPSTLINLAKAGDHEKESLIRDLRDGTLSSRMDIPADVRKILGPRIKKRPEKAMELEAVINKTGSLFPKDFWPEHCLLGNWTGGSMASYLRHYPSFYGTMPVRDVGLIASEGRMTIPLEDNTPSGVLDITTHFFEFIPEDEKDSPNPTVLLPHELVEGRNYFILFTTSYGLYRYDIHDVVRCTGFFNKTPMLQFLNKGSYFSNLTGEKISEYQITGSMAEILRELDRTLNIYSIAPVWSDEQPFYGLFVESGDVPGTDVANRLASLLENKLRKINIEYDSKRESLRLGPIKPFILKPGTWQTWDRERLKKTGGTLEQYKHPCLINDLEFKSRINPSILPM